MEKRILEGKKLLIIGGGSDMISVTKLAQRLGCKVYITDYYDTLRSPAKLVADAYADISVSDIDAVVGYIRENNIDGVIAGYTDSYIYYYMQICKKAGLPYYGSDNALGVATDKMLFKKACIKSGVGVIPGINAYTFEEAKAFAETNGYPLMLKPVDNSGSRGVIKCIDENSLQKCYDYAYSFSPSKNVMVERFMDCDTVVSSYQLEGDIARLSAFCDRDIYKSKDTGSAYTSEARYPSVYLERYLKEEDAAVRKMLKDNGFSDGMVGIMGFVDDNGFYWCEMTYRPSGGHHYTLINDQTGVNGLALLIEFAVTGRIDSYRPEKENPFFKEYCGMIHIAGVPGRRIASMSGLDEIEKMPTVLEVCQELRPGQIIGKDGTTAQTVVSVWVKGKDYNEYKQHVKEIREALHVFDENGDSLLMPIDR